MNRTLKKFLLKYLAVELENSIPGFAQRPVSAEETKNYPFKPFFYAAKQSDGSESFISFITHGRTGLGQFTVECGRKTGALIPVARPENHELLRTNGAKALSSTGDFAVRLFWLCRNRSAAETGWDMFAPEIWNPERESYREFRRRTLFGGTNSALDIFVSGGVTEQFAEQQARLIGGDVIQCLESYAVPFFSKALVGE